MLKHSLILMGFALAVNPLSILIVQPLASTSHHVWTMSLVKGLLRNGHNVHLVSIHKANIEDKLMQNLTSIVFDDMMNEMYSDKDYNPTDWIKFSTYGTIRFVYIWGVETCGKIIKTRAAKELLEIIKNVKFDVIVQDITLNECLYGLWEVAKGKPPVVGYIPFGLASWLKDYVGGHNYPTVRSYCHADLAWPESFSQRTWNVIYYVTDDLIRHYYYLPRVQQLAEQYIGQKVRPLYEIGKTVNIVLINTHSALEPGIPLPPNVLEIAGMHAQTARSITDTKILKFLDEAKDGVVIISLGTNVSWKSIGLDKLNAVILALSQLKQRVIWKLNAEISLEMPDNVMILKWLSQNDVLTHKNVRAIWTHGGLLSAHESVWHGVPLIGMPFYMDQRTVVEMLVAKGVAVRVNFDTLTTQHLLDAFDKVLYNKSYARNMKRLSGEFRDRPMPPLDLAIWSIEYTARHPFGSLASPVRSQSWVMRNAIDVYAFLFFSLIIILFAILFTLKMILHRYRVYFPFKLHKSKQM